MKRPGGQAVVEAALVLPLMLVIGLAAVEVARLADARSGLDAATAAAASAAARAPSSEIAGAAARAAFASATAGYPLRSPQLRLDLQGFLRGGQVTAAGTASFDVGLTPLPGLPRTVMLSSQTRAQIAPWRSR